MSARGANGSGSIPPGWATCSLGEVLRVIRGVTYKKQDSSLEPKDGMLPVLRATNIGDGLSFEKLVYVPPDCVSDDQLLRSGDIVIAASSGSKKVVGKAALFSHDWKGSFGAFCYGLRPDALISSNFVAFILQTLRYRNYVSEAAAGININNLRREHIEDYSIRIAPRPEEERIIAEIEKQFSRLDAGVAALRRVDANLKRYKASVLKSACEGKLTEAWRAENPDVEPASKLLQRILAERRRRWEEAELAKMTAKGKLPKNDRWKEEYKEPAAPRTDNLPELPETWTWASLEQLLDKGGYGTSIKCDYEASGTPVLRIPNIVNQRIDLRDLKFATGPVGKWPDGKLIPGDLLICRTNGSIDLIGKTAVVPPDFAGDYAFASYLIRLRFVGSVALARFIHFAFASEWGRRFITENAASSAGQHNLSLSKLARFPCPLPPADETYAVVSEVEARVSMIDVASDARQASRKRADRLRQSILKDAFEGKLVEQDPTDEPASTLLARIRAEREKRATNGRPKRSVKKRRKGT